MIRYVSKHTKHYKKEKKMREELSGLAYDKYAGGYDTEGNYYLYDDMGVDHD